MKPELELSLDEAQKVVAYWREAGEAGNWFSKNPAFDRDFRNRFLRLHESAATRELDHWAGTPEGSLALMILLDQFPRNSFRGTARMYATDETARWFAREALSKSYMQEVPASLQLFFCLPFSHSEQLADQDISVELNTILGTDARSHAEGHRDIIRRFGRFPHRNRILGRESSLEETEFLRDGGFSG